jgi:hypothetical protein
MECSRIREILFENAGSGIPVEVRERAEAHLAECKSCAALAHALERQSDALRDLPKMEAPPGFLEKVRLQVEKPPFLTVLAEKLSTLYPGRYFFRMAGVAVTVVLVVAVSRIILQDDGRVKTLVPPAPTGIESPSSMNQAPDSPGAPPSALPPSTSAEAPSPMPSAPPVAEAPARAPEPTAPAGSVRQQPASAKPETTRQKAKEPAGSGFGKQPAAEQAASRSAARQGASVPGVQRFADTRQISVEITLSPQRAPSPMPAAANESAKPAEPASHALSAMWPRKESGEAVTAAEKKEAQTYRNSFAARTPPEGQNILSDVKVLISQSNGKILNEKAVDAKEQPNTLSIEIPAENYPAFLDRLHRLGAIRADTKEEINLPPGATVRVTLKFADFQ